MSEKSDLAAEQVAAIMNGRAVELAAVLELPMHDVPRIRDQLIIAFAEGFDAGSGNLASDIKRMFDEMQQDGSP